MCKTAYYWANTWRVYSGPEATDRGKPDRKAGAQIYRPTGTCLRQWHYQIQNARPTLSLAQRSVPRVGRSPCAGIGCAGTLRGRGPSTPPRHPGSGPRYEKRPVEQGWWGASPPSEKQPHALWIFYLKDRPAMGNWRHARARLTAPAICGGDFINARAPACRSHRCDPRSRICASLPK